nr:MAG: hypothetical protein J07AB56_09720 [Candidatus Nanosalinarum sp. J07AB56]
MAVAVYSCPNSTLRGTLSEVKEISGLGSDCSEDESVDAVFVLESGSSADSVSCEESSDASEVHPEETSNAIKTSIPDVKLLISTLILQFTPFKNGSA